jgi:cell division protein FtsB
VAARASAGARAVPRTAGQRRAAPARKVGARKLGPRQRASRVHWDRVGRTALVLVIFIVCLSYLRPGIDFLQSYRETTAAKQDLRELQAENRALHNKVQAADDKTVLEREARRQGMVVTGERPYVIHGLGG